MTTSTKPQIYLTVVFTRVSEGFTISDNLNYDNFFIPMNEFNHRRLIDLFAYNIHYSLFAELKKLNIGESKTFDMRGPVTGGAY